MQTVVDSLGREWRVGRLWFTRKATWRSPLAPRSAFDIADGLNLADMVSDVPGIGVAIALVIAGLILGVLAVFFVLPALALILELLVVLLVAVGSLAARVVLKRPWVVIARRRGANEVIVRRVVGFAAAGRAADELAADIRAGTSIFRWAPTDE